MFFSWLTNRRRRKWLEQPQPREWPLWLRENVWQYRHLDTRLQEKVHRFVCVLFHEKDWAGGSGFQVTDEMRVTIAGQAALMTLGFEKHYYFDRLRTIIVYPGVYAAEPDDDLGLFLGQQPGASFTPELRAGEAWQGGPIVLAWKAVRKAGRNPHCGQSVVIHEFAHHMDGLDGSPDGSPPLTDYKFEKKWYRVTQTEYERLLRLASRGEETLLDPYGATNQAEFFAVACECFFTRPYALADQHPDLFAVLERLFGQDPRDWLPSSALAG